ncbi:MAG: SLBB domain-containing protein [Gemmatimonadaceae bacterium]
MPQRVLRSLLVAACFLFPALAAAQVPTTRPTPEQAQVLLQTRPDLVAQLRQRFAASGLTRDQIHARLRAEGYPEDLLDAYLPGTTGPAPTSEDAFAAVRALGIADSSEIAELQTESGEQQRRNGAGPAESSVTTVITGPDGTTVTTRSGGTGASGGVGSASATTQNRGVPGAAGQTGNEGARANSQFERDSTSLGRDQITSRRDSIARKIAADSGFTIFGVDIFRRSTSQFDPNSSGPVDANYKLGPGDRLVLILTGDVESSYDLPVTREGFVVVPQVGQLFVANLTLGELDRVLYTRLSRVYSGVRSNNQGTTRYSVSVARLRSNQIYVVGDVQRPGSYMVSSAGTALTALYAAGGPTTNGSLRTVQVRRGGRTVDVLDVYEYLVGGDATHDVRLQTGDVVFIPVHGPRVRIVGEIARPAIYEIKASESLTDLVRNAGGLRATAATQRILIERILPPQERAGTGRDRVAMDVASSALLGGTGPLVPLRDGDVVRVFPVAERVRNRVLVLGNVYQPGAQGFTPGMQLSDALRRAGLMSDTYLGEVQISRIRADSSRVALRAMLADTSGRVLNDISLQEDDQIRVFSLSTFRPARTVSIGGAVRRGGRFPYREGMTLRDLVLLANGVLESAYLKEAEVARLPEDRSAGRTATTLRVPLDSTYLFERGPNGEYVGPPGLAAPSAGAPETVLKPYDNVLVLRQPDWSLQRTVVLQGEVRYPGSYALTRKTERLSDLIKRAGGLTDEAYADGIVFNRRENAIGRVGLELSGALGRYESSDNLILRDGDSVSIPAYNAIVTIRGAVNAPSSVAYVRGKDIDYYIGAAGGATPKADESHAYVTQPSGKLETVKKHIFIPDHVPKPRPGSVVTVPENDGTNKRDTVALITGLAQIIASTVAIVIAVSRR